EQARDVVQLARTLLLQSNTLLAEARYPEALEATVHALRVAEMGAPPGLLVTALYNVGEAALRVGQLEDAAFYFDCSYRLARQAGLRRAADGRYGWAQVHHLLGHRQAARMAYEEAAAEAQEHGDAHVAVAALAGLTRLLIDLADGDV